jgi:integrase
MPKTAAPLNAARVAALAKAGKKGRTADGGCPGLNLQVAGPGVASWVLRYTAADGRRAEMGLGRAAMPGVAGGVGLAEARQHAEKARVQQRAGRDPIASRKQARPKSAPPTAPAQPTFAQVAADLVASRESGWRNNKHRLQWESTLARHAFPLIGDRPVDSITTDDTLAVLKPIWTKTPETASRLRQRIEAVLDAAEARGLRQGENPARWRGHLAHFLPPPRKVKAVSDRPTLPWQQVPAFLATLTTKGGVAAQLLRFAILTASRSGEVRRMTWAELDMEAAVWTVPAKRIKGGKPHRVPLSDTARDMLRARRLVAEAEHGPDGTAPDALVFSSRGRSLVALRTPVSDMALSELLRGMSRDGLEPGQLPRWRDELGRAVVPHGFRSTFKAWSLSAGWPDHLSELALAHSDQNAVRAAYARADLLEERRPMMAAWAEMAAGSAAVPSRAAPPHLSTDITVP